MTHINQRASQQDEQSVMQHLEELRRVIIISLIATFISAGVCWFFSDPVLKILLEPITSKGYDVIYISVTEAVMTKLKLAFFLGFMTSLPITLWQFWGFIIPALYKLERIYFTLFILLSYLFFMGGIVFGFLVVFHMCVNFLLSYGGSELLPMLTIGKYVSFTLNFLLPFGLIFELPLASYCLAKLGVISYRTMIKARKIAILASVVIASALVASPDILSVLLMAAPMYLLYEISATIVRAVEWQARRKQAGKTFNPKATLKKLLAKIRHRRAMTG